MRFCSLGSGSGGNAAVVEAARGGRRTRVLIDCGFSLREFETRLERAGLAPADLDAIFVTHEHGDHIGCAVALARRHGTALWMSRGTWHAIGAPDLGEGLHFARDGQRIEIGALELSPFTVAHDAREPLQLRCEDGDSALGVLTDAGSITAHLLAHLAGCDALLLEFNHDPTLLAASRYPAFLRARIGGPYGHLSNDTSAAILSACMHGRLQHVVAAHLSEETNRPERVRAAIGAVVGIGGVNTVLADQASGFGWLEIG